MSRIVFFGTYNPDYPRNRNILKWAREAGHTITPINERGGGIMKYVRLFVGLRQLKGAYDAVFVPFPGHLAAIVAGLATRKKIVFDAVISLYDTWVFDRQAISKGSFKAWLYRHIDQWAIASSTTILLDTIEHRNYFVKMYHLRPEKCAILPAVADTHLYVPQESLFSEKYIIFWHGHFSPLHGVPVIIEAARQLRNEPIEFRLLGSSQEGRRIAAQAQADGLENIHFLPAVPYEELPDAIAAADLCLGVFGTSEKVDRVVPNKVYEYASMGKAIITAQSHAVARVFAGGDIVFWSDTDSDGLVALIQKIRHNRGAHFFSPANRRIAEAAEQEARQIIQTIF